MPTVSQAMQQRYATKAFDPYKKITDDAFSEILSVLQLCPSSVNSQPWHFIIANTATGKSRLAKGTQGSFAVNEAKVLDASHVVLFCAKTSIDNDYLESLLALEESAGRYTKDPSFKDKNNATRYFFTDIHRKDLGDDAHWMAKQEYLNIGACLLAAGMLDIDAVPLEGIDAEALSQEFGLAEKGLKAEAMIAFGYRAEGDFNQSLPKARFPQERVFSFV